jgi:hypothetical protein
MKNLAHNHRRTLITGLIFAAVCAGPAMAAKGDWQQRMLFEPSKQQLQLEKRGRVMIYDGLQDVDIERAMNKEFDRIEHMMFIRTKTTDESGQVVTVSDDC